MNDAERRALGEEKIKDVYAGDVIVPPEGYAFTEVEPVTELNKETREVEVTFYVDCSFFMNTMSFKLIVFASDNIDRHSEFADIDEAEINGKK